MKDLMTGDYIVCVKTGCTSQFVYENSAPGLGAYKPGHLGATWTIQMSDFRLEHCLLLLPLFTHPVRLPLGLNERGAGAREAST